MTVERRVEPSHGCAQDLAGPGHVLRGLHADKEIAPLCLSASLSKKMRRNRRFE